MGLNNKHYLQNNMNPNDRVKELQINGNVFIWIMGMKIRMFLNAQKYCEHRKGKKFTKGVAKKTTLAPPVDYASQLVLLDTLPLDQRSCHKKWTNFKDFIKKWKLYLQWTTLNARQMTYALGFEWLKMVWIVGEWP